MVNDPKYALVVSADEKMLPGANAILNALTYYGEGDIEFHCLYWPSDRVEKYIHAVESSGKFPNFRAVNVQSLTAVGEQRIDAVAHLKLFRTRYAARLVDHAAVCVLDADAFLLQPIRQFFELTAETQTIVMAPYRFDAALIKDGTYYKSPLRGNTSCPYYASPTFFTPARWGYIFEQISHAAITVPTRGEMSAVNYCLITNHVLDDITLIRDDLWNMRDRNGRWIDWKLSPVSQKWGITFRDEGVNLSSLHGRWWNRVTISQKLTCYDQTELSRKRMRAANVYNHHIKEVWRMVKFFNFRCYVTVPEWDSRRWATDNEYIDTRKGVLCRR